MEGEVLIDLTLLWTGFSWESGSYFCRPNGIHRSATQAFQAGLQPAACWKLPFPQFQVSVSNGGHLHREEKVRSGGGSFAQMLVECGRNGQVGIIASLTWPGYLNSGVLSAPGAEMRSRLGPM
jgi:hypothetical protein